MKVLDECHDKDKAQCYSPTSQLDLQIAQATRSCVPGKHECLEIRVIYFFLL